MALALPFEGLPPIWQVLFSASFVVIVLMLVWTTLLFVKAQRARRRPPPAPADGADDVHVGLPRARAQRGGDDRRQRRPAAGRAGGRSGTSSSSTMARTTARRRSSPASATRAHVLRRDATPRARGQGGGAQPCVSARSASSSARGRPRPRDRRHRRRRRATAPTTPRATRPRTSPRISVGGVQSLVRIYNRDHLLTRLQDVEFGVYGFLYQAGRNGWGTAGMGGNGQFNRLIGSGRRRRPPRAMARSPDRGSGSRDPAARRRLGGPPGAACGRRAAGPSRPAAAAAAADALVTGRPSGDGAARRARAGTPVAARPLRSGRLPAAAAHPGPDRPGARRLASTAGDRRDAACGTTTCGGSSRSSTRSASAG